MIDHCRLPLNEHNGALFLGFYAHTQEYPFIYVEEDRVHKTATFSIKTWRCMNACAHNNHAEGKF